MDNEMSQAAETIERMVDRFNVNTIFGEIRREANAAIIPVAEVSSTFGFGSGSGEGPAPAQPGMEGKTAAGSGGGGGGRGSAKPRGVIKITAEGVSYEPFVDPVKLALAGILMVAWNIFWIALTVRAFAKK